MPLSESLNGIFIFTEHGIGLHIANILFRFRKKLSFSICVNRQSTIDLFAKWPSKQVWVGFLLARFKHYSLPQVRSINILFIANGSLSLCMH